MTFVLRGRSSSKNHASNLLRLFYTTNVKPETQTSIPKPRLDFRSISENAEYKARNALHRKALLPEGAVHSVVRLYKEHVSILNKLNERRNARSLIGDQIRKLPSGNDTRKRTLLDVAKSIKLEVAGLEKKLDGLDHQMFELALAIPNDTHPSAPVGSDSTGVKIASYGPEPIPHTPARDHVAIGRALGLLDFETAATVTGSSWYYLKNEAALLEMALANYSLSIAMQHGFEPVTTPDVVRSDMATRCGFQPRDHSDPPVAQMYHLSNIQHGPSNSPELVLTGTAEIPLAGMFANKILLAATLPAKAVGIGRAFRAEAGARGADTRGLYRVHQFTKLELFCVTTPEQSEAMMQEMADVQNEIYKNLGFPFRVIDMPSEELGASAYRKYDVEAWMPGRGTWGEISSLSNCTDYQARRLHIRYRTPDLPSQTTVPFAHTLNGTAAAIPRLIIALIENGARFGNDGSVVGLDLPVGLEPFWIGGDGRGLIRWV